VYAETASAVCRAFDKDDYEDFFVDELAMGREELDGNEDMGRASDE